ncbi:hypothetical protein ASD65_03090 [Microbacterium sp. Root61]|uniref:hypothetical protein n=1 Tax=Microbacterium sp. Root61 TaxID=1736570 RepID=UPI0006F24CDC|nr:hypothetical protein [Microbacterium sp. Root61]KRA23518.1 hypothetical protein ASD65_03090 [Microbacterium sp. Root61]
MAIGRSKGPRVIAAGTVLRITPKFAKQSGDLYAHDVTLDGGAGAEIFVRFWDRDESAEALRAVGVSQPLAVWAEVQSGNGSYGDSLSFDAMVTADDLDRLNSGLSVAAK